MIVVALLPALGYHFTDPDLSSQVGCMIKQAGSKGSCCVSSSSFSLSTTSASAMGNIQSIESKTSQVQALPLLASLSCDKPCHLNVSKGCILEVRFDMTRKAHQELLQTHSNVYQITFHCKMTSSANQEFLQSHTKTFARATSQSRNHFFTCPRISQGSRLKVV